MTGRAARKAVHGPDVPRWLRVGAAWSWRLLLVAFAAIGGAVWLVASRVAAGYPALLSQVRMAA